MPKITNPIVIDILQNPYFLQHTAMHLSRLRMTLPDGTKLPLILPPCLCDDCRNKGEMDDHDKHGDMAGAVKPAAMDHHMGDAGVMDHAGGPGGMIEAGEPGSGRQLLEMHHEMIRAFRFLLEHWYPPLRFLAEWGDSKWSTAGDAGDLGYGPQIWDLDDPDRLPHEIVGMFQVTDPTYLGDVFAGVKKLIEPNDSSIEDAVDALGRFIERAAREGDVEGSGFHDTMHKYLAAREGRASQGAEMNKLNNSRFNDYFWSLHLWIDSQYGRLLESRGQQFDTSGLDPKTVHMCTDDAMDEEMPGMTMAAT